MERVSGKVGGVWLFKGTRVPVVALFENIEGGHGGAADNAQLARMSALQYAFLWSRLH